MPEHDASFVLSHVNPFVKNKWTFSEFHLYNGRYVSVCQKNHQVTEETNEIVYDTLDKTYKLSSRAYASPFSEATVAKVFGGLQDVF